MMLIIFQQPTNAFDFSSGLERGRCSRDAPPFKRGRISRGDFGVLSGPESVTRVELIQPAQGSDV
ncbi:hypothetical protein AAFF_G00157900 [Aldrovandia affinis]|uniref:Uncharacterized protein n=1 Tax=Aldrovandia affinis TaxID=143900 RepID=A0AAD7RN74_9TELE|nr:hypothetical protein AAFF_G00157900 [Aldrovandia affinis]